MKIGLVFDLRKDYLKLGFTEEETAEFDSEETVSELEGALRGLGHEVVRVGNCLSLMKRISCGERWDLVFNVAEGLDGRSREAQAPAVLEACGIPYVFSDPLTLALSLDKALAKRVVRDAGVPTAKFRLLEDEEQLVSVADVCVDLEFPLFLKPNHEGTGKGISRGSLVWNTEALVETARGLMVRYRQPVLVEQYLPGREFTVGVLGTGGEARVAGVIEVHLLETAEPFAYSYVNKELCEEKVLYELVEDREVVEETSRIALEAYRVLGVRDAGRVDLRADGGGRLMFMEVNPLAGLHPTHSDLPILCSKAGIPYRELIGGILESALKRRAASFKAVCA